MVILDNYEEIFAHVFPDLMPDDLSLTDPDWHDDLAHLNPKGTVGDYILIDDLYP